MTRFPARRVSLPDAEVTYIPTRIIAPEGTLEYLEALRINRHAPAQLHRRWRRSFTNNARVS